MDISFVLLSWNSARFLGPCLRSVAETCAREGLSFEILVADNGSTDASGKIFDDFRRGLGERFTLISLPRNFGTTYPRNLGLAKARGRTLCVLDSDTEILPGRWRSSLELLAAHTEIGLLAPKLILPDGRVQNSVKRFPALWHKLLKIPQFVFRLPTPNRDFYQGFPFARRMWVDSAISACWLFRRDLLERVGGFDEKIFYSPEDLDVCIRVLRAGYGILYAPELAVVHHTQQITRRHPFSRTSMSHLLGLLYFYRKHGGWFGTPSVCAPFEPAAPLPVEDRSDG